MKTYGKKFNVLILEEAHREGMVGNAIERLIAELEEGGARVMVANSYDDCYSMIFTNTALDCLMLTSAMSGSQAEENDRFFVLIDKLNRRQQGVPVFLLAERKKNHVARYQRNDGKGG